MICLITTIWAIYCPVCTRSKEDEDHKSFRNYIKGYLCKRPLKPVHNFLLRRSKEEKIIHPLHGSNIKFNVDSTVAAKEKVGQQLV